MKIIDDIRLAMKFRKFEQNVKAQQNPMVQVFGSEKTYGRTQPNDFKAMIENYQSWAYACVTRNAFSVAKSDLELYRKVLTSEGADYQEILDHPFLDLMKSVNPFFNRFELWVLTVTFLDLTGNAYWWLIKDQLGVPRAIWNVPSHWMKIVPSKTEFIAGYVMQIPGSPEVVPFDQEDIIHFKYPSPFDLFYGCAPMYAAAYDVDMNREMKAHGVNFLMNSAQPAGVLTTEQTLSDREYERLKTMWNLKHRGSKNSGKLAILEAGLKYEKTGSNLADLQFSETSNGVRDSILSIFGVPASQLGLIADVNRANAEANEYVYQQGTIAPKLRLIEEKLNEKLMPIYDVNLYCEFESNVPDDKEFRLREQQTHIASGYSSIDDEREEDGKEPYDAPETSAPLIPFSVIPAGTPRPDPLDSGTDAIAQETDPNEKSVAYKHVGTMYETKEKRDHKWNTFVRLTSPQEATMTNTMRRFFQSQQRIVNTNLNKLKSLKSLKSYPSKAGVEVNILFSMSEENQRLRLISKPLIQRAVITGAKLAYTELTSPIDFDLIEPNLLRVISSRGMEFANTINSGTSTLLEEAIKEGVSAGESISDISKRVNEIYSFSERFRSKRIAQTEVIGAANEGQLASYIANGVEGKEWLTARDERVRESHQIDGQVVDITENFVLNSGELLQQPGDRSASVGEIVNCRCSIAPIVRRE